MSIGLDDPVSDHARALGRSAALARASGWRDCVSVGPSDDPRGVHARRHAATAAVTSHRVGLPPSADPERRVATPYGMLHPNAGGTAAMRAPLRSTDVRATPSSSRPPSATRTP